MWEWASEPGRKTEQGRLDGNRRAGVAVVVARAAGYSAGAAVSALGEHESCPESQTWPLARVCAAWGWDLCLG